MGRAIAQVAADAGLGIAGGTDRDGVGEIAPGIAITTDPLALAERSDVLIDFSVPGALSVHLDVCIAANKPILIGTTGLEAVHHALIDEAAAMIPVLQTGNTSLGVNLLAALVEQAAAGLGDDWDIEIVEMHHRHKVDAPSGTALMMGEAVAGALGRDLKDVAVYAREGHTGPRERQQIGFQTLRGGDTVGDHTVFFFGEGERVEIRHVATNRANFAVGAVRAALWAAAKAPALYDMRDVLNLK